MPDVSPLNQKIREFIRKHPSYKTGHYSDLATKFNVTLEVARHQARAVRQEKSDIAEKESISQNKIQVMMTVSKFIDLPEQNKLRFYELMDVDEKAGTDYLRSLGLSAQQLGGAKNAYAGHIRSRGGYVTSNLIGGTTYIPQDVKVEEVEFNVSEEILLRKDNAQIKALKKQLESVLKDYDKLNEMYDVALALRTQQLDKSVPVIEASDNHNSEACAIISLSDGHFGKIVTPSTVNGLNEFNPEIAKKRMDTMAENSIKLIRGQRSMVNIDTLYLDLGGDFIDNNQLHPHQEMSTHMSPFEETLFARDLISKYIRTIAENGNFTKIIISCIVGNHPRISPKMSPGLNHRLSYEYMMYQILKTDFNDSLFTWHIPESDVSEVMIYGNMIRSFHGHQIRSMGGVGGLTIPLNKYILRMDQINPAFYNLCHHFHNLSNATKNCMVNGAVCGYDAYALSLGCEYDEAKQSFILLDRDRGITIKAPIFCD